MKNAGLKIGIAAAAAVGIWIAIKRWEKEKKARSDLKATTSIEFTPGKLYLVDFSYQLVGSMTLDKLVANVFEKPYFEILKVQERRAWVKSIQPVDMLVLNYVDSSVLFIDGIQPTVSVG